MADERRPGRLLLIEGHNHGDGMLGPSLASCPHDIDRVDSASAARQYLSRRNPELILLDLDLADGSGLDLLYELKEIDGLVAVVVFTGRPDVATVVEAMKRGADNFLAKPVESGALLDTVERVLSQQRLKRRAMVYHEAVSSRKETRKEFSELVGASSSMERARDLIQQVAETESSIVLLGETGTGKGLAARAIHDLSRRATNSFVDVNCATLPPDLVESEIFGHEKGAFTGAQSRKPGLLEIGDGGTVFLDEITELQPQAQSKLLKCIEDRSFRRVGGVREVSVNVRFVVATHQNLEEAVKSGKFREDLYYRLNVFQLHLPALRERGEDILDLALHFIKMLNPIIGRRVTGLSPRAAELLCSYSWPGNVRELRNVLERAMILARSSSELRPRHLPENLRRPPSDPTHLPSLSQVEAEHIRHVLEVTQNNIQRAARILGISRSTLYAKMKHFHQNEAPRQSSG